MSALRRLQSHSSTFVFRYAAVRLLEVEVLLDRRLVDLGLEGRTAYPNYCLTYLAVFLQDCRDYCSFHRSAHRRSESQQR